MINSHLLYRLSYHGIAKKRARAWALHPSPSSKEDDHSSGSDREVMTIGRELPTPYRHHNKSKLVSLQTSESSKLRHGRTMIVQLFYRG